MDIFEYKGPLQLLDRLNRQHSALIGDCLNSDKALDFCLTAWSLADWDFYSKFPGGSDKDRGVYRNQLFPLCDELKLMHDIANGTKHFTLTKPKGSQISSIEIQEKAGVSTGFSFGFNRPCIKIVFKDTQPLILNVAIDKVHAFWNQYLLPNQ